MTQKYWESTREDIPILTRKVINEYLLSLKLTNKAEATITKYRWILERFFSECLVSLGELTSGDVLTWLNKFSTGKNTKTLNLFLSTLSSFFRFCLEEEYLENMVIKTRWRLKIPQGLPNYLNEQEYAQVKLAAEKLPLRDRALVLFLFSSGCRRAEVAKLCIENVNLDRRTAEILGKGNKYRQIHFSVECAIVLKEYLLTRTYEKKDPLFMNKFGNKLQSNGIYNVVRKLGKMAGLSKPLFPHCCRHTFATNLLARGADLQFIADELGHADLNTTRVYARIPTEDLMLAYHNIMG